MDPQSTLKILARLNADSKSSKNDLIQDTSEIPSSSNIPNHVDQPELNNKMEDVLTNILGYKPTKQCSPVDK